MERIYVTLDIERVGESYVTDVKHLAVVRM
jgi:hypothetical protein